MTIALHWASWAAPSAGYSYVGSQFTDATITAQDTTNAATLAGKGYVANPTTAWTAGQYISISGYQFSWTGSAWAPGYQVVPGGTYPAEPTVTASDATNAAKLAGLGFVAVPATAWTTGQQILIGAYAFNWTGSAWAAGAHALMEAQQQEALSSGSEAPAEVDVGYDPGAHTVAEVEEFVAEHPDQARELLDAEVAGKNRVTLVNHLNSLLA